MRAVPCVQPRRRRRAGPGCRSAARRGRAVPAHRASNARRARRSTGAASGWPCCRRCWASPLVGIWAIGTAEQQPADAGRHLRRGGEALRRPVLSQRAQRPGHRLERALLAAARGLGLAAAVGIPLGFVIGRFDFVGRMFGPLISLRNPCRRWPGSRSGCWCSSVPTRRPSPSSSARSGRWWSTRGGGAARAEDYQRGPRANLNEWKVITRILFRGAALHADRCAPVGGHGLAGDRRGLRDADRRRGHRLRVWDEWNNLNVQHIIGSAIFVIGIVGLALEQLIAIARRFSYEER